MDAQVNCSENHSANGSASGRSTPSSDGSSGIFSQIALTFYLVV